MAGSRQSLLAQIESGALDGSVPLADVLRKCVALGGQAGSIELRDWALHELNGYTSEDDLPDFRIVPAIIALDGVTMVAKIKQQQISASSLPDFTHDHIKEEAPLTSGVAELEALVNDVEPASSIRLSLPMASDLVRYMNHENRDSGQQIVSLYWAVSPVAVRGVLDRIRTMLTGLVAEMRAAQGSSNASEIPTSEAASQAVNVIVKGSKRSPVTVTTAQAADSSRSAATSPSPEDDESQLWAFLKRPATLVVGTAGVVTAVAAVGEWQGWNPF